MSSQHVSVNHARYVPLGTVAIASTQAGSGMTNTTTGDTVTTSAPAATTLSVNIGTALTGVLARAGHAASTPDAVVVNIAASAPTEDGSVSAWGTGPWPGTATMSYSAGASTSTIATLPLADDGTINVRSSARSHLAITLIGAYVTAAGDTPGYTPHHVRLVDTRTTPDTFPQGAAMVLDLRRVVPETANTALLSVTTNTPDADADADIYVYPQGQSRPLHPTGTSNPGHSTTHQVLIRLNDTRQIIIEPTTTSHLVVDLQGYSHSSGDTTRSTTVDTARIYDSATQPSALPPTSPSATTPSDGALEPSTASTLAAPQPSHHTIQVAGRGGVPHGARWAYVRIGVTATEHHGGRTSISTTPNGIRNPRFSYPATGTETATTLPVALSETGNFTIHTSSTTTTTVDVTGYGF